MYYHGCMCIGQLKYIHDNYPYNISSVFVRYRPLASHLAIALAYTIQYVCLFSLLTSTNIIKIMVNHSTVILTPSQLPAYNLSVVLFMSFSSASLIFSPFRFQRRHCACQCQVYSITNLVEYQYMTEQQLLIPYCPENKPPSLLWLSSFYIGIFPSFISPPSLLVCIAY